MAYRHTPRFSLRDALMATAVFVVGCSLVVSGDDYSSGQCSGETKACFGACVGVDSVKTGCGNADCAPCRVAGAAAACQAGKCVIGLCIAGFADCDGDQGNGCEADIKNEAHNCGSCQRTCPGSGNARGICRSGVCGTVCNRGYADCKGQTGACETAIGTDVANCGKCGAACAIGSGCIDGVCTETASRSN